jgi:hypothetical protein
MSNWLASFEESERKIYWNYGVKNAMPINSNDAVNALTKVVEVKGKAEALVGAVTSTVLSAILIFVGVAKWKREKEINENPEAKDTPRSTDSLPASWILFVVASLMLVGPWVWFFLSMRYKGVAIAEGLT